MGWTDTKKKLPPEGKWVLVYCDEIAITGPSVFIARSGYVSPFTDGWLWESQSEEIYTQSIILGWIDIPEFKVDNEDTSGEILKRYEILDFSTLQK